MILHPSMTIPVALAGVLGLFSLGMYALLTSHNLIKIIVGLQFLVKAAELALVTAGYASGQINLGQSLAITVLVADTVVAVVALAFTVQVQRRFGTLDVRALSTLRR